MTVAGHDRSIAPLHDLADDDEQVGIQTPERYGILLLPAERVLKSVLVSRPGRDNI